MISTIGNVLAEGFLEEDGYGSEGETQKWDLEQGDKDGVDAIYLN